jgi:hypothetical protein
MMLETLLEELPKLEGAILFSMFMLPGLRRERERIYAHVLDNHAQLHAALEETVIRESADVALFEDTIQVANALRNSPLSGRFAKDGRSYPMSDPFVASLTRALRPA